MFLKISKKKKGKNSVNCRHDSFFTIQKGALEAEYVKNLKKNQDKIFFD